MGGYAGGSGCVIGRFFANFDDYYFKGWIDEVRVSKGIARWTSNFTPPTQPYYATDDERITFPSRQSLQDQYQCYQVISRRSGTEIVLSNDGAAPT